jgi:1-deoxy-D-xylulose-5-phosphate synthase
LTICQPKDEQDFAALLNEALERNSPTVIRYPRGAIKKSVQPYIPQGEILAANWTTGDWVEKANAVASKIAGCQVVHMRTLKPFDEKLLASQRAQGIKIISLENAATSGGIGEAIGADLKFGWPDEFIPHGQVAELEKLYNLDVDSIVEKLTYFLNTPPHNKG